jgi:hypothetical protein
MDSILALPARNWQGCAGLYVAGMAMQFFAISNATFGSRLNSKLRGGVESFPVLATWLPVPDPWYVTLE